MVTGEQRTIVPCTTIDKLCKPLYELGVHYFQYIKIFPEGVYYYLGNCPERMAYFHDKSRIDRVLYEVAQAHIGHNMHSYHNKPDCLYDLSITHKFPSGVVERAYFGADTKRPLVANWYLHHWQALARFISYFKSEAHGLIREIEACSSRMLSCAPLSETGGPNKRVEPKLPLKKILFDEQDPTRYLSKREAECVMLLVQGYTAREIAEKLVISIRTVEAHIDRIRVKMDCRTRACLVQKLMRLFYLDKL